MRTAIVTALLALATLLVPAVSAQVTVTVASPSSPIVPGEPVSVPVTLSADCATVLSEYDLAGNTELELEIKQGPAWISAVGDTVSFSADMCDPTTAEVESTGNLVLTADAMAPGLETFDLVVGPKGEESSGTLSAQVAFVGTFLLESPGPEFMLEAGNGTGTFTINYTGNAAGMAMIQVVGEPEFGTIEGLASTLEIDSPLVDNQTSRLVPLEFSYKAKPGANFSMDMVTVQVMMHAADDQSLMGPTQEIMFHFMAMDHEGMDGMDHEGGHAQEHDHSIHEHASNVPSPGLGVVLLGAIGVAFLLRRRL